MGSNLTRRALLAAAGAAPIAVSSAGSVCPARSATAEADMSAALTAWSAATDRLASATGGLDRLLLLFDTACPPWPAALIWQETDEPLWKDFRLGYPHEFLPGERISKPAVDRMARRPMGRERCIPDPQSPGRERIAFVPNSDAQRRADEIVAAQRAWDGLIEAIDQHLGIPAAEAEYEAALADIHAFGARMASTPACSMKSAVVKAQIVQAYLKRGSCLVDDVIADPNDVELSLLASILRDVAALA